VQNLIASTFFGASDVENDFLVGEGQSAKSSLPDLHAVDEMKFLRVSFSLNESRFGVERFDPDDDFVLLKCITQLYVDLQFNKLLLNDLDTGDVAGDLAGDLAEMNDRADLDCTVGRSAMSSQPRAYPNVFRSAGIACLLYQLPLHSYHF
jgi:hypothetical protein